MSPKLIYSANLSGRWGMSVRTCLAGSKRILPSGRLPSREGSGKRGSGQPGADPQLRTNAEMMAGRARTVAVGRWGQRARSLKPDPWIRSGK